MQALFSALSSLNSLDSSVTLTVMIALLGLIFRLKPTAALLCGIRVGICIWGISAVTGLAVDCIDPLGRALTENWGLSNSIIDGGCGVEIIASFAYPLAFLMIPAGLLLNIILLLCKGTKTLDLDVGNYWGWLHAASLTYLVTGSHLWALAAFAAAGFVTLKLADLLSPRMQKAYGLRNISFTQIFAVMFGWPAPLFNKLFDLIGLGRIKADPTKLSGKLQAFNNPMLIIFLVTLIMCLAAGMPLSDTIATAVSLAGIMLILPFITAQMAEGIQPIGDAARGFMLKKFKSDDYYIGMDSCLGATQPINLMVNALSIPFYFILALILPGVDVLPAAGIAMSSAVMLSYAMPWFDNNIVKGLLYVILMMVPALYAATWSAPYLTELYVSATGAELNGALITNATPFVFGDLCAWIAGLFA